MLDSRQLKEILPHAYPFLLIDRVEEYKEGEYLVAIKNITSNEWAVAAGRDSLIFPETLLIEAAAQAGLILYHLSVSDQDASQYFFGKLTGSFENDAKVGDLLIIKVNIKKVLKSG